MAGNNTHVRVAIYVPMYGIFTYMYHKFRSNVGKYSIHGAYGMCDFQSLNGHL